MASRFATIVDAVEATLDDATILFTKGRKSLHLHEDLRRIIAIPVTGDLTTYKHDIGGRINPDTGNRETSVLTRSLTVEWHIWDMTHDNETEQFEDTEQMLHDLIGAIYQNCMGTVEFQSESWVTQTDEAKDYAAAAEYVIATTRFDIPVVGLNQSKALTDLTDVDTIVTVGWDAYDTGFDAGFLVRTTY